VKIGRHLVLVVQKLCSAVFGSRRQAYTWKSRQGVFRLLFIAIVIATKTVIDCAYAVVWLADIRVI